MLENAGETGNGEWRLEKLRIRRLNLQGNPGSPKAGTPLPG